MTLALDATESYPRCMSELGGAKGRAGTTRSPLGSPLAWSLLGVVIERPSYGYELAQRFKRAYGDTLTLSSHKNIYELLDALSAHGYIEEQAPTASEKPAPNRMPKPIYGATAEGRRTYEEWLASQLHAGLTRQVLFVRQLAMLEPDKALEVLDRYEQAYLEEGGETDDEEMASEAPQAKVVEHLAQEEQRLTVEARLSWMRYARRELRSALEEGTLKR